MLQRFKKNHMGAVHERIYLVSDAVCEISEQRVAKCNGLSAFIADHATWERRDAARQRTVPLVSVGIWRPLKGRSSGHLLVPLSAGLGQVAPGLRIRICLSRKNTR